MIKIKLTVDKPAQDLQKTHIDVFRIPMYTFKFPDHHKYVDQWKKYNDEYQHYIVSRDSNVSLSLPNFHKKDEWAPLTKFFEDCIEQVKTELKFEFETGITSMWSTIQGNGGYHHMHTHRNCMFVGTYYLYSDVEDARGTMFHNALSDFTIFRNGGFYGNNGAGVRLEDMEKTSWYDHTHHIPFEEGKLVLYPGWMKHSGVSHPGHNRQIVAFNVMPIGHMDKDPYQRYFYTDFRDLVMPYDDK
jgi:hypothetical protein